MKSQDIRSQFLAFFESKKHQVLQSAPMVLKDDPSLYVCQFRDGAFQSIFSWQWHPSKE